MPSVFFPSFQRFMRRLSLVSRHLAREGTLYFVVLLVTLFAGFTAIRTGLRLQDLYDDRLQAELLSLLKPTEPRTTNPLGGLESLILSPVNSDSAEIAIRGSAQF